jgi:hypothetical protein
MTLVRPSSPRSPPRNLPSSVNVRKASISVSQQQTGKDASSFLTSASQATIVAKTEIQKISPPRPTEKPTTQVAMMSRPSSAPLVPGGPRPTTSVSVIQTAPPLARSASATGRLGPDPSPATHSHVPQSYRNAMMGNHMTSTATSFTNSSSSSGVHQSSGYSQPPLVSSPIFLSQSSDKMDSMSGQSSVPFSLITRDVLQNGLGPQWMESSHRDTNRSMHYEPSSRLNDVQNFDMFKPVNSRSLDQMPNEFQACTSRRQNQGLLADEFPHLDIINDLLDDEHGIGNEAGTSSVFQSFNDGSHMLNRQFTYPGDLDTNDDLGSSTSCRFERSRSYHDPGFQQGYGSSIGHFDYRDYNPQASTQPYGNGKVDGLVPNHWQMAGSDLSYLGLRNPDNDGYSYYQDYSNLTGVNGYTVFRPSNGQ